MKAKDELFMLIKSMDKNEKGYFRKFSKIHSNQREGNYLKLFDCLASMETYNEAKVREKFKGEKFLSQLAVTKLYLRNLIIKSLKNYLNDSDPDLEMLNTITEVSLLNKRKMYDSALRLVHKLKKTVDQREEFLKGLFLLHEEYHILMLKDQHRQILDGAQANIELENRYIQQYKNLCEYKSLQVYISHTLQIEGMAAGGSTEKIRGYLDNPLLKDEDMALSFRARYFRFEILSKCYLKLGEKQKALTSAHQFVDLFNDNPGQIKTFPTIYISALVRLITRCNINHRYSDALKHLATLEGFIMDPSVPISENIRYDNLVGIAMEKLAIYTKSGEYEKGAATETSFASFAKDNTLSDQDATVANYFHGWCKLATGKPADALKKVNPLINNEFPVGRKDVILSAYGMNILIHYELGNYSIIKRLLKMLHNYIVANKFPETGWPGFVKIMNEITEAKINDNHKELKKKFHDLSLAMNNYDFLEIGLMTWWVNSKLNQK